MTTCATDGAPSPVVELSGDVMSYSVAYWLDGTAYDRARVQMGTAEDTLAPVVPGQYLLQASTDPTGPADDLIDPRGSHGPAALPLGLGGLAVVLLGLGVVGRRRPQGAVGTRRTS